MYTNVYCKKKFENINHFNPYPMIMPAIATGAGNIPLMVSAQKLQPSAAPFEPNKLFQKQLNEVIHEQKHEINPNDEAQSQNNTEQTKEMLKNETSEMNGILNHHLLQCGNNMLADPPAQTNDALLEHNATNFPLPIMAAGPMQMMPHMQSGLSYMQEPVLAGYHPLQHIWTMWYLETDRSKTWEEMQNEISSVNNVEDFWRLYNHIKPASEIKPGCDYSLFKHGIRPMWEDEANRDGGRWIINLPRCTFKLELDSIWLDVLLCLIGETFEHTDQICGAVVNVRSKTNKVSVWTSNGQNAQAILEIGFKLRDILRLHPQQLHYQLHKDTMSKTGGTVRSVYVL